MKVKCEKCDGTGRIQLETWDMASNTYHLSGTRKCRDCKDGLVDYIVPAILSDGTPVSIPAGEAPSF